MTTRNQSIDGLRCLAVLSVLIFHIDKDLLTGGYLGVDLFFVISGYVVTKSLVDSRPRYTDFLLRRFYRLFPAASVTIFLTLVIFANAGSGLLTHEHIMSALASLTATSNIYYMLHSNYFDTALQGNPFLHFWSLSVEEQYYLIWPWVVLAIATWRIPALLCLFVAAAIVSAALFIWSPAEAFYLMPARAFQFGAGTLVFFIFARRDFRIPKAVIYGSAAVAVALMLNNDGSQSWVLGVLAPTAIFGVLVAACVSNPLERLLSLSPVQAIGAASYSIYLVHWPIIVYAYILYEVSVPLQIAALVLSLVSGLLLHHTVEKPFNYRRAAIGPSLRWTGGPIVFLATLCVWSTLLAAGRYEPPETAQDDPNSSVDYAFSPTGPANLVRQFRETEKFRRTTVKQSIECRTYEPGRMQGNADANLLADIDSPTCLTGNYLLFADSTARSAVALLATIHETDDIGQLNTPGCVLKTDEQQPDCTRSNNLRFETLAQGACPYEAVYLAFAWSKYSREEFKSLLGRLSQSDCRIVVMSQLPSFSSDPRQIIGASGDDQGDLAGRVSKWSYRASRMVVEEVEHHPAIDLMRWSPLDHQPLNIPAVTASGDRIYRDGYHHTSIGVEWLVFEYLKHHEGRPSL